jgi:hypothetical protein
MSRMARLIRSLSEWISAGRGRFQRGFADFVPQPGEVIEVALDLGLGALSPAVRTMQPIDLGSSISAMIVFRRLRSEPS